MQARLPTIDDGAHLGAAALFELRSILDCADGSLARAKRMSSPNGHAIDAMADWLGVVLLYLGIYHDLYFHTPEGVLRVACMAVVSVALAQGAIRSFASDYFRRRPRHLRALEDQGPELLRSKVLGLHSGGLFAHIDVFIMRMGHLMFEFERFCPKSSAR